MNEACFKGFHGGSLVWPLLAGESDLGGLGDPHRLVAHSWVGSGLILITQMTHGAWKDASTIAKARVLFETCLGASTCDPGCDPEIVLLRVSDLSPVTAFVCEHPRKFE